MSKWEADLYEKADYYLPDEPPETPMVDAGDSPEVCEPDPCPVRWQIFVSAQTVGEMMDRIKQHGREYCEECGQVEFTGYEKQVDLKRAA